MRAIVVKKLIGPDGAGLDEIPEPQGSHWLSPGERMLLDVHAAAICFPDLLQTRGQYQHSVPAPFVAGGEVAGVVVESPPGSDFAPGDRVLGLARRGAMAERALVPPGYVLRLPDGLSFAHGAAVYINYCTAWYALHRAGARPDETVLVQGAAGGVGTAVLQLAPRFGVRTIAVVSSDAKEQLVRGLGANEVVRSGDPWLAEVRGLTGGRGVQVVIDMVGGDRFTDSVRVLAIGGRLIVVGFAAGSIPTLKVNRLLLRNLTLIGISMDIMEEEHPGTVAVINAAVQALLDDGTIVPVVGARVDLENGAEALRIMERREALGKIVIDVRR
ncbi:MAG: NADPH:quinone reductase [Solirubrobacteraceae bacterium]|nr:NADPH:quinone reductase [Solirubrobacteraceae bacterium]